VTREEQIESAATAYRETRADSSIVDSPAWHDLDEEGRVLAHTRAAALRRLEAALDPDGLSTMARALLQKIGG